MDTEKFINQYLTPSQSGLDSSFIIPLPDVPMLRECGDFIVQGHLDTTISTNIINKYESRERQIRLLEVYKNSQNLETGVFVRLVGTMSLVKQGYPFMFLDAAVSNVNPMTAEKEELSTRVAIHMPQADSETRGMFTATLSRLAEGRSIDYTSREIPVLPEFWGPLWSARAEGIDFTHIRNLRDCAWTAYSVYCDTTDAQPDFDYSPMQDQMVFKNSAAEYQSFQRMGVSVPAEAQAAFFSIICFKSW